MAAFLVGLITVKDPEKWRTYVEGVKGTLVPFGGEVLFRGEKFRALAGEHEHENVVALRFPDREAVESWYGSAAYEALIPVRDAAADVVLIGYEG